MKVMSHISLAGRGRKVRKRQKEGKVKGGRSWGGWGGVGRLDYEDQRLALQEARPQRGGSRASIKAAIPNKILPGKPH